MASVSAGNSHSLFLKTDGTLRTMGNNFDGQLGDGSNTNGSDPVQVASGVARVAAGGRSSFFIKTDGSLWATGYNDQGQLGTG